MTRTLALTMNQLAKYRAAATSAIRCTFEQRGAVEVRTPVFSTCPDLAPVRQFTSRHPCSGTTYCLRIAPEEHLTRLIGLGVPAVYEISTNFRCETIDASHLVEFESIEALFAKASMTDMMDLMEQACRDIAQAGASATGQPTWVLPTGMFPRVTVPEWIESTLQMPAEALFSNHGLHTIGARLGCIHASSAPQTQLMDEIVGAIAKQLGGAVFVGVFPAYLGGPAARDPMRPNFIQRYELYYDGIELGSGAQQLRDVADWQARYEYNIQLKRERGIEPNRLNEELLADLAGLPEFAGLGLGFERLLALALGLDDIRQVRLFEN